MAIVGAARLADALDQNGLDHVAAFRDYHDNLRCFVDDVQGRAVKFGMATMSPSDDKELAERNRKLHEGSLDL